MITIDVDLDLMKELRLAFATDLGKDLYSTWPVPPHKVWRCPAAKNEMMIERYAELANVETAGCKLALFAMSPEIEDAGQLCI